MRAGEPDPFATAAMEEIGIDISRHTPHTLRELHDTSFDLIVTLSPEAHHQALELTRTMAVEVEYWPTLDATMMIGQGSREQILEAYRDVRDQLFRAHQAALRLRRRADGLGPASDCQSRILRQQNSGTQGQGRVTAAGSPALTFPLRRDDKRRNCLLVRRIPRVVHAPDFRRRRGHSRADALEDTIMTLDRKPACSTTLAPDRQPAPRDAAPRTRPHQADRAPSRPQAQAGAGQRLAPPPHAAGPGRHRARRAAPLRDRRAALQKRDAALAGDAPGARQGRDARDQIANDKDVADAYVLAADTVVAVGRRILVKPQFVEEATSPRCNCSRAATIACLRALCLITPDDRVRFKIVDTRVRFKRLSKEEMEAYIASREWRGKAGGYAIQGLAGCFVQKLTGSYTNVVGLPLTEVVSMLLGEGFPIHFNWLKLGEADLE